MSESKILSNNKFLFISNIDKRASSFCCFDLDNGVIALGFVFLFSELFMFYGNILDALFNLFTIIGTIMIIYSGFKRNVQYSYCGYFILAIDFYFFLFKVFFGLLYILLFYFDEMSTMLSRLPKSIVVMLILAFSIVIMIKIYFLWIFYSYYKLLKDSNTERESER